MAQNRMTHQALLDQLQGADTDVLRRVLEHAMQRLIDAEAETRIGAGPHERSASRTTCSLVRTSPSGSIITPEPTPSILYSWGCARERGARCIGGASEFP